FAYRHLGPRSHEVKEMLTEIGADSIEDLCNQTVPESIRVSKSMQLPEPMSEAQYAQHIQELGEKNKTFKSYIGLGYHHTHLPAVIQRNILENPGWYTAYTPYQAEIAQGRLEAVLNFQTMICELTGMPLANASLLDESTAAAEAMTMLYALRPNDQKKKGLHRFFVDENVLPQTLAVLQTRSAPLGIELVIGNVSEINHSESYFGVLVQYPGKYGNICDLKKVLETVHAANSKTVVAADLMSLVLLEAPGVYGADVVVGNSQRFGIPLGYGGPHAGFFATKTEYKRSVPGRIIGVTQDLSGSYALRMALQTREQHIKRDRATSNICTAQVLLAVMAAMYAVHHGPKGIRQIAEKIHQRTCALNHMLGQLGVIVKNKDFFDTLFIETDSEKVREKALEAGMNFHYINANHLSISLNETTELDDVIKISEVFKNALGIDVSLDAPRATESRIPNSLRRKSPYLTQEVFNKHQSETALMRYIKKLERKDLSLNHSMIPLGSCTMKLNAASQLLPLSTSNWNSIHPFAPTDQAHGYQIMLSELENYLNEVTGFSGTSLQPNSGAQGEFSGLMVIRAYHHARDDQHRNICLIPSSAHGTNPASAVMAGMKIVVVGTDKHGNINLEDLRQKAEEHADHLAALMVTYPSTHGVFESSIKDITEIIHRYGGQVYMDGANMNAQVGLTNPAIIGADVCHLNLHKTFAIPHGGGGPGVGPICVAEHLVPFLPKHPMMEKTSESSSTISAAPWGSALVCLISYAYIRMLGSEGLKKSTELAILNANYIKTKLEKHYPILYSGEKGRAAHEFIIDCRPFKEKGIEVIDIAKRLMDYGFHAPTVSFPVPGTMMIEPTESENKEELDRFCTAMISIRFEIEGSDNQQVDNILRNAPHTLELITNDKWEYPYSRSEAAYPLEFVRDNKFWPSVRRVDEAFGDRNLICTCAPISTYVSEKENV
ncbi:MAG: aminomethyl-transferring glycine dehydrogenase, partial [Flavobacteriaceae bacterium]